MFGVFHTVFCLLYAAFCMHKLYVKSNVFLHPKPVVSFRNSLCKNNIKKLLYLKNCQRRIAVKIAHSGTPEGNKDYACSFSLSAGALKETNELNAAEGDSDAKSARSDVDQDVFLMFSVVDENMSWYLKNNIQRCFDPETVDPEDPDFKESNLMHGER